MGRLFHSPLFHCIKIKPPPDIIVTTKVIQKCILLWQTANYIHLFLQKPDVSCRNTIPGRRHCCHIIEHMTFRFFNCTKVRHHLFRLHNHFAKKYHAWADNFPQSYASFLQLYVLLSDYDSLFQVLSRYKELHRYG